MSPSNGMNVVKRGVEVHRGCSRTGSYRSRLAFPQVECLEDRTLLSWVPVAGLPTPRFGLAAATGSDGVIYALGGTDPRGNQLFAVEAYQTTSNTWTRRAPLITNDAQLGDRKSVV